MGKDIHCFLEVEYKNALTDKTIYKFVAEFGVSRDYDLFNLLTKCNHQKNQFY